MTQHASASLPGIQTEGPDPRMEWVSPRPGVVGTLAARLGSDADPGAVLVAVLDGLRTWLKPDTMDAILDELPWDVSGQLRGAGRSAACVQDGLAGLVADAAGRLQRTPDQARYLVGAVLATLRTTLARGHADAVDAELPADVAAAWRTAR